MRIIFFSALLLAYTAVFADAGAKLENPLTEDESAEYPMNAITDYGEELYPGADMDPDLSEEEQADIYRRGRMAFLFGEYDIAFKIWEPLANNGYSKAQATLGWIYHTGKGARKNLRKAHYWYERAAQQAHEIALNNLGVFYEQGLGVGRNFQLAAKYYQSSANLGYKYAQYNLGMLYLKGRGVQKNKNKAIYWLEISSYQGVEEAKEELEAMGRKVKIPQHQGLQKNPSAPKWHKSKHGSSVPAGSDKTKTQTEHGAAKPISE